MRVLITAGSTREKIDEVRDWGNIFTGTTGYRIAQAVCEFADVELITSNTSHLDQISRQNASHHRLQGQQFTTHAELKSILEQKLRSPQPYDAIFMSAAVADYCPAGVFAIVHRQPTDVPGEEQWIVRDVHAGKVRSTYEQIAIAGRQTEKLVDLFRTAWKYHGLLVKFKLEVGISRDELIQIGQASRKASKAEYLLANTLDMIDGPAAGAFLLSDAGAEWVSRLHLPQRLASLVAALR